MKTKLLLTTLAIAWIALASGCKKDDYTEITSVCPVVVSTSPVNGAINVPVDQVITATFDGKVNPATVTTASFLVTGTTAVAGSVSYSGQTAYFVPSAPLTINTTYTARIKTSVKDFNGNALQRDYTWTFSTGSVLQPMVISTDPANGATGVFLNKTVTADFNVPMDPATLNGTTFTLKHGATAVTGIVSYSGSTAYFTPTGLLLTDSVYTATLTTGIQSLTGTALGADYTWSFTTGSTTAPNVISTVPASGATSIPVNQVLSATFSEVMNPLTLTPSTFTLRRGVTVITGSVSYSGTTASFTPSADLDPNSTYTATVTTGAENLTGVPLANDHVWTFSTLFVPAPTVIATDPVPSATSVPTNKIVTATFSEPMDPLSIDGSSFTLFMGAVAIAGSVSYSGTTATFTPSANLSSGSTYTARITTGATNVGGIPLASDYVWSFSTVSPLGPTKVDLATVARFGIIAGVGVSNNAGFSVINNMDVGISPGVRASVTGFPPGIVVGGAIYCSDDVSPPGTAAMLINAKQDLTDAYLFAEAATSPAPAIVSGDIGGTTLAPGIYKSTSTLMIQSGDLILDGQGDANASWIFQIASDFTTVGGAGGNIILINGANAANIFWQTGSSATIGDFTTFKGNILALTSITMNSGAVADGRMLARNGAVVMTSTNIINKP